MNTNNGYCECGCGDKTKVADQTRANRGWVKGEHKRFIQGHHHRARSTETRKRMSEAQLGKQLNEKHHLWQGGRFRTADGYTKVRADRTHPMSTADGYILEHRLVMATHLGRMLEPEEVVHHENHVRTDNRIENLRLFGNNAAHRKYHLSLR